MESELAACPICGEECRTTPAAVVCAKCNYESRWANIDYTVAELLAANVENHNTLARRAEVGALVERIVDGLGYVQMECEADANGEAGMYDVRSHDASAYTDTLLDALRALAKEVNGDD